MNAQFLAEGDLHAVGTSFHSLFSEPRLLRFSANETRADRIYLLLHELLTEFCEPGTADSPVSVWVARSVLWKLAQTISLQDQQIQGARAIRQHTLFPRFLLLVEQHFLEHWPLQNYASRLGLSIPRLNRLVRAEKSCNALEVIHERLTREACRRLIYIAVPTSSLAVELGFEDPAYFSRFFKRRTGHSPQQYRQVYAGNVGDTQSPLGIRREAARRPPE
jgi:AraC family transcriptional activator of pobA